MLQAITSSQRPFMRIDAADECAAAQRFMLLDSLNQIHEEPQIVFATGPLAPEIDGNPDPFPPRAAYRPGVGRFFLF